MRLDDLVDDLENTFNEQPHVREHGVKVILDGNEFSISRVEHGPDGVLIILETYPDNDLYEAEHK